MHGCCANYSGLKLNFFGSVDIIRSYIDLKHNLRKNTVNEIII